MRQAIIGLDGGGSNLRILIVDKDTEKELYSNEINTGTNLSTVPNKQEALENIKNLIIQGARSIPNDYYLAGIGLSSAGTEIEENKLELENALKQSIEILKKESEIVKMIPPKCFVTNDIDVLLHSADIAIVAGTGTVGAVKYKDNNNENSEYKIYKLDGNGPYIGDKGSGYWIAKQVLTKVSEIENLGGYMNSKGEFIEVEDSYLKYLVFNKLFEENGIKKEEATQLLKDNKIPEFVSLVYSATQEDGKPFDRAKVGNLFARFADKAAYVGDEVANDILEQASAEIFKNIKVAYKKGNFEEKEHCDLLLSGSVLVHNDIVRYFLERRIEQNFSNVSIKVNHKKPVWSTISYVKGKLEEKEIQKSKDDENEEMDR